VNGKQKSGLLGMVVGGVWLLVNLRHVPTQGFVAIGMPLLIAVAGVVYFIKGRSE
jgi:hypothetical protein